MPKRYMVGQNADHILHAAFDNVQQHATNQKSFMAQTVIFMFVVTTDQMFVHKMS